MKTFHRALISLCVLLTVVSFGIGPAAAFVEKTIGDTTVDTEVVEPTSSEAIADAGDAEAEEEDTTVPEAEAETQTESTAVTEPTAANGIVAVTPIEGVEPIEEPIEDPIEAVI